jgi:hypothetical protein
MNSSRGGRQPAADGPLDDVDLGILDSIRQAFGEADPMPPDLPERIRFSLALRDLEYEVARLAADQDQPELAARGAEQSRTVTFDSDSLTIMIRIDSNADGTARVDGWLAPPQRREIEMKTTADLQTAVSDEQGRFAFTSVPRGTAQLLVRPAEPGTPGQQAEPGTPGQQDEPAQSGAAGERGSGRSVVTPALIL